MGKEFNIVSTIILTAIALESCAQIQNPSHVSAAPLEPQKTLPQPAILPVVSIASQDVLPQIVVARPYPYFSQNAYSGELVGDKAKLKNRPRLSDVGCGLIVGGIATRTNPDIYQQDFDKYFASIGKYGPARVSKLGSDMADHLAVLQSLDIPVEDLSLDGLTWDQIKAKIIEKTNLGYGVWVNATFFGVPHHSFIVGWNPKSQNFKFYDPLYGQNREIADSDIGITDSKGNVVIRAYAIESP